MDPPPTSTFPDLDESKKAWMRQEKHWSEIVRLYRTIRGVSGPEAARNALRDGPGYLVEARTWVPFYAPEKAFILYLCWEQSRLHGNAVTLQRLDEREAAVALDSVYLRLYKQSSHMRELLSESEYRSIFETLWKDRALAAGWSVAFSYDGDACLMRFTREGTS